VIRAVIDTNIFVAGLLRPDGASRRVLRLALTGGFVPLFGTALCAEYEALLARQAIWEGSPGTRMDREALFDALLKVAQLVRVSYAWRPNLRDEGDNHVVELAVAGAAHAVITSNLRDFAQSDLTFPGLRILTAHAFLAWRTTA
jgi:putative PIN family toxin of toxin-antitoxin system